MGIYRGPGGTGDATNDAASEATLVSQLVTQAQESEANAAASATAAQTAENNAETAETNAETSATNAATSEANALTYKNAAATSATNAASSASAASTSASNAATSATNASNSASSASTSASTATTQATNASNSASAAATSATNASNSASAAATSATNAASSATSASGSASTATTQASNASTSATNAAASATSASGSATTATTQAGIATTQATNAANSASAASTSATNAASSATAAAGSATTASTQATNASNSATSAASSATAAAASYDSFDDRYLGAKSTAPTVDNDGNALLTGALYFNSSSNTMKVWNGSAWLDAYASLSGALIATNNLSDLNSVSTARTNLGLGTSDSPTFAGLTDSGNFTFTGTGNRIRGDFSNGTLANRVMFQTSGTNVSTNVYAIPNGTSTNAFFALSNNSDPTNSSLGQFGSTAAEVTIRSGIAGTGTYLPLTMYTGGSERLRIDTSGNVGIGTASPSQAVELLKTQNASTWFSVVNANASSGAASGYLMTNDTGALGALQLNSSTNTTSGAGNAVVLRTLSTNPLVLATNSTERMRIDSSGNVGIGTSSGTAKFTVKSSGSTSNFEVDTSSGLSSILSYDRTASTYSTLNFRGSIFTFSPSDAEKFRIDASGNVGVGTTTPSSFISGSSGGIALRIASGASILNVVSGDTSSTSSVGFYSGSSSSDNPSIIYQSNLRFGSVTSSAGVTGYAERMRIDSSGNVGIGTSSPSTKLTVSGTTFTTTLSIPSGADSGQQTFNYSTANINSRSWRLFNDVVAYGDFSISQSTTQTGTTYASRFYINSSGNVGIGTTSPTAPLTFPSTTGRKIGFYQATEGYSIGVEGSNFKFVTDAGAVFTFNNGLTYSSATEHMRIDSSGNVGVGTSSPTAKLDVNAGANTDMRVNTSGSGYLQLGQFTNGGFIGTSSSDANAGALRLGTAGTERMRITSTGFVGIGSTSPTVPLQVNINNTAADQRTGLLIRNVSTADQTVASTADIDFSLWDNNTQMTTPHARIGVVGDNTANQDYEAGGQLCFYTNIRNYAAPVLTERMRIDSSGNVGIGTTTPGTVLDVNGSPRFRGTINAYTTSSDRYSIIPQTAGSGVICSTVDNGFTTYTPNVNDASLFVWRPYGTERMRLDNSGRVLIGTTTAQNILTVSASSTNDGGGVGINNPNNSGYFNLSQMGTVGFGIGGWADSTVMESVVPSTGNLVLSAYTAGSSILFQTNGRTERMRIDSSGNLLFNSGYGSVATAYGCRAWVKFNGTGTVTINASGNVSSITDNGTGDYSVNFTNAMPSASYCVLGTAGYNDTTSMGVVNPKVFATGSIRCVTTYANALVSDYDYISVAVIR